MYVLYLTCAILDSGHMAPQGKYLTADIGMVIGRAAEATMIKTWVETHDYLARSLGATENDTRTAPEQAEGTLVPPYVRYNRNLAADISAAARKGMFNARTSSWKQGNPGKGWQILHARS